MEMVQKKNNMVDRTATVRLTSRTLRFESNALAMEIFGSHNSHLSRIEELVGVICRSRGYELMLEGSEEKLNEAEKLIQRLMDQIKASGSLTLSDIDETYHRMKNRQKDIVRDDSTLITSLRSIHPKTDGQRAYVKAILDNEMVFGIGPAGTGKTYLATAVAVHYFLKGLVKRIILTRPAIEAGEKLGFLPGSLTEKVDPYLRPLYDAMNDMLEFSKVSQMIERGQIEVAPLAFMRGRTLNDAFVILDEAQNCTKEQMRMFLTRLGTHSRCVITGDVTQVDLPDGRHSGLEHARQILKGIEGISFHFLNHTDVVRHPLVQKIILAYEGDDKKNFKGIKRK